jgi:glycerol uptake facilitator-like aquaporin
MIIGWELLTLELLGTFALVYVSGWTLLWDNDRITDIMGHSLSLGLVFGLFTYLSYSLGALHLNPAVSLATCVFRLNSATDSLFRILAQMLGSLLSGGILWLQMDSLPKGPVKHQLGYPMLTTHTSIFVAFFTELMATLIFAYVFFAVSHNRRAKEATAALCLGSTLLFNTLSIGNVTGSAMNPARVFGPSIFGSGLFGLRGEWLFYVAPTVGGLLGGAIYRLLFVDNEEADDNVLQQVKME